MLFTNLLTNMIVVMFPTLEIPTNTAVFQNYVHQQVASNSFKRATSLHLERSLVTASRESFFSAKPNAKGIVSSLVFSDRYAFVEDPAYEAFCDRLFHESQYRPRGSGRNYATNNVFFEEFLTVKDKLTMDTAFALAESRLKELGIPMRDLGFASPEKIQWTYPVDENNTQLLPYYKFLWTTNGGRCEVHVSGASSNVVFWYLTRPKFSPTPIKNYFEMLGIPTNSVLVVEHKSPPGHPKRYEIWDYNKQE